MTESEINNNTSQKATFAGGCFWCLEETFRKTLGVKTALSGYTGGKLANPSYEKICMGTTGHLEAVQVTYDPSQVTYRQLLEIFWDQIDPTDPGGQFSDRGSQYNTAIFYHTREQQEQAETSRRQMKESGRFDRPIVTEIRPYTEFYPAEEYHQEYSRKCPVRYKMYKKGSGRQSL